ncbi:hypothetical protein BO70DRAFT_395721 [Aspergillus heteromorphus CBS 117.55]|uniref:Uncharacterized protein n=1 Tax=Aspergillus heteromorphus CBS 117.55 TaxID=1448321 RepID=A0A317WFH9_9EURO|nr:uncharacterized protein BO70DRAFT_395721 [Aspergillus heteromorphus CBS 117.55]PWY85049.1 hypothetical protein BO70DRAFT_395721 [Aspergillus heteromorphus CBS 117.55]
MSEQIRPDTSNPESEVRHWQIETTWFYFPCMDQGYRGTSEHFQRAIDDLDHSMYALYRYCPAFSEQSWGVLIFVHHPINSDLPIMLAYARRQLENLRDEARIKERAGYHSPTIRGVYVPPEEKERRAAE